MVVVKLNEATKQWEEMPKGTRGYLTINHNHYYMLNNVKKVVMEEDRDWIGLYCGNVGDGKSTKMAQDLKYLDPTFNVDRMCQTEEQFKELVQTLKPGQAIALDEAFDSLSSSQVASKAHQIFVNLLQVIRQQNLFIGLSLPNFFDLNKTTAIFRSNVLIYVFSVDGKRTHFKVFGREEKKQLYIYGKKNLNDCAVESNYEGRFNANMQIDEERYREKKKEAFMEREEIKAKLNKAKLTRDDGIRKLREQGRSFEEIADLFGLSVSLIQKVIYNVR